MDLREFYRLIKHAFYTGIFFLQIFLSGRNFIRDNSVIRDFCDDINIKLKLKR